MKLAVFSSPFGRALTVMVGTVLVTVPYTRVIDADLMILEAILTAVALVLIAVLVRGLTHRFRGAGRLPLTIIVQLGVLLLLVTARGFASTATFGFVPRRTTLTDIALAVREAMRQIVTGVAPLSETVELHLLFITGIGVYAIAMYALLVWSRSPIPAAALTAVVAALPSIIVGFAPSPGWFVALAVTVLVMFWQCGRGLGTKRVAGVGAAVAIGASATLAAVCLSQVTLTGLVPMQASGAAGGYEIDASLDLGQDLRRPTPVTALTYVTSGAVPYLRVATLSSFHEDAWQPDPGTTRPLSNPIPRDVADEILAEPTTIAVDIERATGTRLPIPVIPRTIEGLGAEWGMDIGNYTVTGTVTQGQTYEVEYQALSPSIDALRAVDVAGLGSESSGNVPPGGAPLAAETAREFVAAEPTRIDALLALERWLRTEFSYSLDPPIADTANLAAIDAFLVERSGYCVHFASTFALMARHMGLPSRVVVGFLPGEKTGTTADGTRYRVSTDRLHAWPEVFFGEYGWIPFEPTATLGTETAFRSSDEQSQDESTADPDEGEADPLAEAQTPEQREEQDRFEADVATEVGESESRETHWPFVAIALVVVLLGVPALTRAVQRIRRVRAALRGDAVTAWDELTATVVDLGIAPDDALTPRGLAEHLHTKYFVDREALSALVTEVEYAAYAPRDHRGEHPSTTLGPVMRDLRRNMGWWQWVRALILPTSLIAGLQEKS